MTSVNELRCRKAPSWTHGMDLYALPTQVSECKDLRRAATGGAASVRAGPVMQTAYRDERTPKQVSKCKNLRELTGGAASAVRMGPVMRIVQGRAGRSKSQKSSTVSAGMGSRKSQ